MEIDNTLIIGLASMFITLISVVTGFILQLNKKKIKNLELKIDNLEFKNSEFKRRFGNALDVIEGHHKMEDYLANKDNLTTKHWRSITRQVADVNDFTFYTSSKLKEKRNTLLD